MMIAAVGFGLASLGPAAAEDTVQALVFTVHPSGIEGIAPTETLDEKLARRERSFRFICLGCVRVDGRIDSTTPFYPVRTLNAPQLTAALAAESRSSESLASEAPTVEPVAIEVTPRPDRWSTQ